MVYSNDFGCLSSRYEHFFGPLADHNLCVTNAMKEDLQRNWGIKYGSLILDYVTLSLRGIKFISVTSKICFKGVLVWLDS